MPALVTKVSRLLGNTFPWSTTPGWNGNFRMLAKPSLAIRQVLASNNLTTDQRKAIREHLGMNIAALRDLVTRNRLASRTAKTATPPGSQPPVLKSRVASRLVPIPQARSPILNGFGFPSKFVPINAYDTIGPSQCFDTATGMFFKKVLL
jgi:hypothetical protein